MALDVLLWWGLIENPSLQEWRVAVILLAIKEGGMCREEKVGCREDHNAAEVGRNLSWTNLEGPQANCKQANAN